MKSYPDARQYTVENMVSIVRSKTTERKAKLQKLQSLLLAIELKNGQRRCQRIQFQLELQCHCLDELATVLEDGRYKINQMIHRAQRDVVKIQEMTFLELVYL